MTTAVFRTGQGMTDTQRPAAGPEQATRTDQRSGDIHGVPVGAGADSRHANAETQPIQAPRGGHDHPTSHAPGDTHARAAGGAQTPEPTKQAPAGPSARAQGTAAATAASATKEHPPLSSNSPNGHARHDGHIRTAVGDIDAATSATQCTTVIGGSPGIAGEQGQPATHVPESTGCPLADPTLALLADVLDDLERTRIANENRLRQLTRDEPDADGEERGFGLDESHPDVARLAAVVQGIGELEHQATLNLARVMRAHPLGPWVRAQRGVGEKQAARLLAAIGDPYWNTLHDRPRTVSELWAYCGLHTLPAGQSASGDQRSSASGTNVPGSDHSTTDNHLRSVAARRKKGERANWSGAAKMRAWNIAGSMLKAGNRETYDRRKAATEGRLHAAPCIRCGPSGKPAQPGTPWSDAHRHADALRIVSKELLKQLWLAARDIHHGHRATYHQGREVVEVRDSKLGTASPRERFTARQAEEVTP